MDSLADKTRVPHDNYNMLSIFVNLGGVTLPRGMCVWFSVYRVTPFEATE